MIRILAVDNPPGESATVLGVLDEQHDGELVADVLEHLGRRQKASLSRALTRLRDPDGRHLSIVPPEPVA